MHVFWRFDLETSLRFCEKHETMIKKCHRYKGKRHNDPVVCVRVAQYRLLSRIIYSLWFEITRLEAQEFFF